jgi:hypothetical protein
LYCADGFHEEALFVHHEQLIHFFIIYVHRHA